MKAELTIITPEAAPGGGGVADYTLRLVEQWSDRAAIRLVVPKGGSKGTAAGNVTHIERRSSALVSSLPTKGGAVLLQYSAYGFDPIGYPRWLLRGLVEWRRQAGGLLVIMFHEIWTFWPMLSKHHFVQQLHRRDIGRLLGVADAVFTSTASQAEYLRALAPRRAVEVLPVGSNIRPLRRPLAEGRRPGLGVLFGLYGTRLRTLEVMRAELFALSANKVLTKVITAGTASADIEMNRERELLEDLQLSGGFEQRGESDEREISELLMQASFGISGQDQLSVTKSGTVMAYSAHQLNIISPHAAADGPEPLCWFTSPAELAGGITANELSARANHLRAWQERTASWPLIAEALARALQLPDAIA